MGDMKPATDDQIVEWGKRGTNANTPKVRALIARVEQEQELREKGTIGPGHGVGWTGVAKEWAALPRRIREWVAELETRADPAGDLRQRRIAEDRAVGFEREVAARNAALATASTLIEALSGALKEIRGEVLPSDISHGKQLEEITISCRTALALHAEFQANKKEATE